MYLGPATGQQATDLVTHLTPALAQGNVAEALELVRENWTLPQLVDLLTHVNSDVRKVAALALGLMGDHEAVRPLAVALHDADAMVNQMAEYAMWSIWFRLGKPEAVSLLKRGSCHLGHGNYDVAAEKFTQAIEKDPTFAEAYNQRAIGHYLAERYEASIEDCKAALARMPQHFGAMAGMGHCFSHLKKWKDARHCYRLALAMHPQLEGIQAALAQIEEVLQNHAG